jgi:hypothetical protein
MGQLVLPKSLGDWTFAFIESLVDADYFETDSLDFKEFLVNRKDPKHRERVQKSACAFANSKGGFLVFGVADRDSGKIGRSRIVGIDKGDLGRLFGEQVNGIQPNIKYTFQNPPISMPSEHNKVIFIVYTPRSFESPHTFGQDGKFLFYKRTNKGNEPMTFLEIDREFAIKSTVISKLTLLHVQLSNILTMVKDIYATQRVEGGFSYPILGPDPALLEVTISDLYPILCEDGELLFHLNRITIAAKAVSKLIANLPFEIIKVKKPFEAYNSSVQPRKEALEVEITEAFRILGQKYGIETNPILELQKGITEVEPETR